MATRRGFLAYCGGTTLVLYGFDRAGAKQALAATAGGTLDPASVPRFVTPLAIPPVMPRSGTVVNRAGTTVDCYEISIRQFSQQILPAGLPVTTVWGYGPTAPQGGDALARHHTPAATIEARCGVPVRVKWINDLRDTEGNYLPHLLPVDPTLHWANPPGGDTGRDTRPGFDSTPSRYTGPVPMVTHVHGAVAVGDESDGYPEAWYLPAARNLPAGYATEGSWYGFFKRKAAARPGVEWESGCAIFEYPNLGRAAADWYHDHTLGITRLNVYAGPTGFYILRGGPAGDAAVKDRRNGARAVLPGPAPKEGDRSAPARPYREFPIAIQDRSFNADGSLFYPESRELFDQIKGPYLPETDLAPIWNPEFFGNTMTVNGNTWPYLTVQTRRYRLRLLNGCTSRFLILDFGRIPGVSVWQIGNEGGLLGAPVDLSSPRHGNRLLMAPAERADLIVDFAKVPAGRYVLGNVGPDEPFRGGVPEVDFDPADRGTTGQILQFRVVASAGVDPTTPPRHLALPRIARLPAPSVTRRLALIEQMSMHLDSAPAEALLGTVDPRGRWSANMWMDAVTENPSPGAVETWEMYNTTGDAHPMHVHEVKFEVVDRQAIAVDEAGQKVTPVPGTVEPPEPWETGLKDTVVAYPHEVVRIKAKFDVPGQYVWHCHIVEHEDNEMMRPYRIGPVQTGQPAADATASVKVERSPQRRQRH